MTMSPPMSASMSKSPRVYRWVTRPLFPMKKFIDKKYAPEELSNSDGSIVIYRVFYGSPPIYKRSVLSSSSFTFNGEFIVAA